MQIMSRRNNTQNLIKFVEYGHNLSNQQLLLFSRSLLAILANKLMAQLA